MSSIESYYDYSLLSLGAYANNLAEGAILGNPANTSKFIDAGFTQSQIQDFSGDGWEVISQSSDSLYGDSGFSSTLFHNAQTGEYVFSNRGTAGLQDLFTDAWGIATLGVAGAQIIDMYRYYKQLITPAGQAVTYTADEIEKLHGLGAFYSPLDFATTGMVQSYVQNDVGLGKLSSTQDISVTGHSLGGHLSVWLNALIPGNVDHVYTINGAGLGGLIHSAATATAGLFGGINTIVDDSSVTNIYGQGGATIIAGVGGNVGQNVPIVIEAKSTVDSVLDGLYNHSNVTLSDSLAIQALLNTLDVNLSPSTGNALVQAASNQTNRSLESLLDSLLRMMVGNITTGIDDRELLYTNLKGLNDQLGAGGALATLAGNLHLSPASTVLASEARTEFSALMALQTLSTVVLRGSNQANQTLLDTTLGGVHADTYALWQADQSLSAADRDAGNANFSDAWLTDRATLLNLLVQRNTTDTTNSLSTTLSGGVARTYIDIATNTQVDTGSTSTTRSRVVFGTGSDDSYFGGAGADRLYGGAGADQLHGGAGNDYIEGGGDDDQLYGEVGNDELIGGAGRDTLTSGTGSDILNGGSGFDVYNVSAGSALTTIRDADGSGAIVIERADHSFYTVGADIHQIAGSDNSYEDDEHNRYRVTDNHLVIQTEDGRVITVENFATMPGGTLGIELGEAEPLPPHLPVDPVSPNGTVVGTDGDDVLPQSGQYGNIFFGLGGNDEIGAVFTAASLLDGGVGNDSLWGGGENDWILGGEGMDAASGSWGNDHLEGGEGSDFLDGRYGNDELFGDIVSSVPDAIEAGENVSSEAALGDVLMGWVEDDLLVGTARRDVLGGGKGEDLLIGGAGDDLLAGDRSFLFYFVEFPDHYLVLGNWGFSRDIIVRSDGVIGVHTTGGLIELVQGYEETSSDIDEADILYAGAGDDFVLGGGGDDRADGGSGNDLMFGEIGNDVLLGQDGDDVIHGGGSNDVSGRDYIDGGDGADTLYGGEDADTLYGGVGNDTLVGDDDENAGADYLNGESGDDILFGSAQSDTLIGGAGDDILNGDDSDTAAADSGDDFLDGGDGNDQLFGVGGSDTLIGGEGADRLFGDGGNDPENFGSDYLDGGDGDDLLVGGGGSDTIIGGDGADSIDGDSASITAGLHGDDSIDGGAGNDTLIGSGGSDTLLGGSGNDHLYGDVSGITENIGNDVLDGGDGDDYVSGEAGNDQLLGGAGNDTIYGGTGNDVLTGGAGVDVLYGGAGNDTYVFDADDLQVIDGIADGIIDTEGSNTVIFNGGLTLDSLTLTQGSQSGSILFSQNNNSLGLVVRNGLSGSIVNYGFSDGTVLSASNLVGERYTGYASQTAYAVSATLLGGTRNDTITGYGNDSFISGGRGNDQLSGGEGSTTYQFNLGDGADEINDVSKYDESSATKRNTLSFGAGITAQDLSLSYSSSAYGLKLLVGTGGDSITLDQFDLQNISGTYRTIDTLQFQDGTVLSWAEFVARSTVTISSTATLVNGSAGRDLITGGSAAQTLSGGAGDDRLNGAGGDDLLIGGAGNDTYVVDSNSGTETIDATDIAASVETLELTGVTDAASLSFFRYDDSLYIRRSDNSDAVMVLNHFTVGQIDAIRLGNGTTIDPSSIAFSSPASLITSGADVIYGTLDSDTFILGTGDIAYGGRGNDVIQGGERIYGEEGDDTLTGTSVTGEIYGGTGDDTISGINNARIYGGDGNDVIRGRNVIYGDAGNDYIETQGDFDIALGGEGNDTLAGSGDRLEGGEGSDTYLVRLGFAENRATESDLAGDDVDTIRFGAEIRSDRVAFRSNRYGDMVVSVVDAAGATLTSLVIDDALLSEQNANKIERATFDDEPGVVITLAQMEAMARLPTPGQDYIRGTIGNDVLSGGDGNDQLLGLAGNDLLVGGTGADTYVFSAGFGQDIITDTETGQSPQPVTVLDTIRFDPSIHGSDLQYSVSSQRSDDLVIRIRNTTDQVTVTNFFSTAPDGIERIEVDSYTVITRAQILESFSISGTPGADVLNALEGGSRLLGLAGNDTLNGNAGNDYLDGGVGADQMFGREGNDVYVVDDAGDLVSEQGGDGIDSIESSVTFSLSAGVENLSLTGFNAISATGNELNNTLSGNGGANTLDGGLGADLMTGGYGNDIYVVDNLGDQLIEGEGFGTDRVESSISFVLAHELENLTLTGIADISGTGNAEVNVLIGNAGANILDGGAGADSLRGGSGDDLYMLDALDTVTENAGEGVDTVRADFTATLAANVENLILTGAGNIDGQGNGLANNLQGNSGDNRLNGLGGADRMAGEQGNDWYDVDDAGDVVVEDANAGDDLVFASVSYALSSNVESLSLNFGTGLNATGNALANTLTGNYLENILDGGLGADTMSGRGGADTYVVDDIGDQVFEDTSNFDVDTVYSSVSYELSTAVENLVLTGSSAINATGNTLNNVLTGNSGNNTLIGGDGVDTIDGGAGNDRLEGGSGNDSYQFGSGYGQDVIVETATDAQSGTDVVVMTAGVLPASVVVARAGLDLVLTLSGSTDQLTLQNFFDAAYPNGAIDSVRFADGTVWDANALRNMAGSLTGTAGNDTLNGTSGDDQMSGLAGNDTLNGNAGNDTLDGGTGTDSMNGGLGNDIYIVDNAADVVTEASNQGTDRVDSSVSWTLGANVENLALTGSANINGTGNGLANRLTGNNGANVLSGFAGDDFIDGGLGADVLIGGEGQDTYIVNDAGDAIVEQVNEGWDTVKSSISTTLAAEVEVLMLTGTNAIDGIGNSSNNQLFGNSAANHLTGGAGDDRLEGGTGSDALEGGIGDDHYIIDDTSDSIIEFSGEGAADYIESFVTYTMPDNVERLMAVGQNIAIYGNSGNNELYTQEIGNTLDGGTGDDILQNYSVTDTRFIFGRGYGHDTVRAYFGGNIVFNASVTPTDVIVRMIGADTYFNIAGTTDVVRGERIFGDYSASFSDGTQWSVADVQARAATYVNHAPTLSLGISDKRVDTDIATEFYVPVDAFADSDAMERFTYSATLENGNVLPSWVTMFDGMFRTNPTAANIGTINVRVTATDTGGATISDLFTLTVGDSDQNLVGTSGNDVLVGKTGNDTLDGGAGADQMTGKKGNDTYFVDDAGDIITEASNEGNDTVRSTISYTLGSTLENLTLLGFANLAGTGNSAANVIVGNGGNNAIDGKAGADSMFGGAGNDTYVVDNVGDVVTENSGEGTDAVLAGMTYTLAANVENLTLTATAAINGTGNALANTLTGNSGNNVLDGGTGNDTMVGGAGNDTYVVESAGDVVTEGASAGTDVVQASISYTLGANVENLTLTGTAALNATGNTLVNTLTGNSGDNVLDGGTGADTMIGGAGNDTYVVDVGGDVVTEAASQGTDLVKSAITYTLGSNVENLTLTGTAAINGTGNTLDNILTGNSANNTLTGGAGNDTLNGGTGTDTMVGGAGNDIYYVDVAADVTTENANEGIDLINSAVTRTLAANIELLFLTGSTAINGTGNSLANLLRGNSVNNTLVGGGGTDILEGGAGNDTLSDTSGNTLLNGGAGTDTLTGGSGNDLLIGGLGNDALTTGSGADIIAFNKGDGQDTVAVSTTKDNTLSIGGGALYADLLFSKNGNDLVLKVGATDQITLTGYYANTANRSVNRLQMVIEGTSDYVPGSADVTKKNKIETFDFGGLVSAFDAARAANPSLTSWALSGSLAAQYVSGSDAAALGGDLAYRYARLGMLSDISFTPAMGILGNASFGSAAQTLQPLTGLQDMTPRLN